MISFRARQLLASLSLLLASGAAHALVGGLSGYSGKQGVTCGQCHAGGGAATVTLTGPANLQGGATGTYTLTLQGGPAVRGGFDVAIDNAAGQLVPVTAGTRDEFGELTHNQPLNFAGNQLAIQFRLVAPGAGGTVRIFAAGLSANGNGGSGGDAVGVTTFNVAVTANGGGGTAPTIATAAAASPAVVSAKTTNLTVLGGDDNGEAALGYTWSSTGPAAVAFAPNGNNAAKSSVATFSRPGVYSVVATVRDAGGLSTTSTVAVTVQASLTAIVISPWTAGVPVNATQKFTASGVDQFGGAITPAPVFTWSVPLGGTVDRTGLFTAGPSAGGPFPVSASAGGQVAAAQVSVGVGRAPNFVKQPAATPDGLKAALVVLGNDDGGEPALSYEWRVITGPGQVNFAPNATNAAKSTTATFPTLGTYTLEVIATDNDKLTVSTTVLVSIDGKAGANIELVPGQALDPNDISGGCGAAPGDSGGWLSVAALLSAALARRRRSA